MGGSGGGLLIKRCMEERSVSKLLDFDILTSSRKDWVEFYGCIKYVSNDQSLHWQSLEILSLFVSLSERDTELELEL